MGPLLLPWVSVGSRCNVALDSKGRLSATAPCPPALGGGERLGAEICPPGKGNTMELPGRGEDEVHRHAGM